MNPYQLSIIGCLVLFVGTVLTGVLGHCHGRRRRTQENEETTTGTVDAAVLSLLGLLIAFTFSNAYERLETRRRLIVDEVNAIGTAQLRTELLPAKDQSQMRTLFAEYVRSRLQFWNVIPDRAEALRELAKSQELQRRIWSLAVESTRHEEQPDARKLLLPALNDMIDITSTRVAVMQAHPPFMIFLLLGIFSLTAGWLIGFGMSSSSRRSHLHLVGFAAAISLSLYVVLDIEYPRLGLVRLDAEHRLFEELIPAVP